MRRSRSTIAALSIYCLSGCPDPPIDVTSGSSGSTSGEPAGPITSGGGSSSTSSTSGSSPFCGDGVVDDGEACDDGNEIDGDACTNACTAAACGDGVVGPGEACDDGNLDDTDQCTNTCAEAVCGDGIVQTGEACDEGDATALCDADCTLAECGDGVRNQAAGEACDDGDTKPGDACSPVCVETKIRSLAVGGEFVCVAFEYGGVRCWGQGEYGAVGRGETDDMGNDEGELPVADIPLGGPVQALAAGLRHVCALLESGDVQCWGYDAQGQAGHKLLGKAVGDFPGEMPPPTVVLGARVTAIGAGQKHTCAVLETGSVRCWGDAAYGALGLSSTTVDVPGILDAHRLALGANYSCVLLHNGEVRCWGANTGGELGIGTTNSIDTMAEMPPDPVDLTGPAIDIAAGTSHTCALMADGAIRCWGVGLYGALGNGESAAVGSTPESLPPPPVLLFPGESAIRVTAGNVHSCAVLTSGGVRCWGDGRYQGRLGYADDKQYLAPPDKLVALGGPAAEISSIGATYADGTLGSTTCALLVDGKLQCWGNNTFGQLGQGHVETIGDDETPEEAWVPF